MPILLPPTTNTEMKYELRKTMAKYGGVGTFVSFKKASQREIEHIENYIADGATYLESGVVMSSKRYTVDDILMIVCLELMIDCNIIDLSQGEPCKLFTFETSDNTAVSSRNKFAWSVLPELVKEEIVEMCIISNPELLVLSGDDNG